MKVLMYQDRSLIHRTLPNNLGQWSAFIMRRMPLIIQPVLSQSSSHKLICFPVLLWWERSSWRWVPCAGLFSLNFYSKDESLCAVQMHQCCPDTDFSANSILPLSKHVPICVCINLHCTCQSWFAHSVEISTFCSSAKTSSLVRRSLCVAVCA